MSVTLTNVPLPKEDRIAEPDGYVGWRWFLWFQQVSLVLGIASVRVADVGLTEQEATIAPTDFTSGNLAGGLYRFSFYVRVTRPATVNSSIQVSISWQDGGVTQTFITTGFVGNTTTTYGSESKLIHIDAGSPVLYSAVYASVGATSMQYCLYVTLEEVNA